MVSLYSVVLLGVVRVPRRRRVQLSRHVRRYCSTLADPPGVARVVPWGWDWRPDLNVRATAWGRSRGRSVGPGLPRLGQQCHGAICALSVRAVWGDSIALFDGGLVSSTDRSDDYERGRG